MNDPLTRRDRCQRAVAGLVATPLAAAATVLAGCGRSVGSLHTSTPPSTPLAPAPLSLP